MYIRDPNEPKRVLTVARRFVEEDVLIVGWALCRPTTEWRQGDEFYKKRGRDIAVARMEMPRTQMVVSVKGQKPIHAVMHALSDCDEKIVQDLTIKHIAKIQEEGKI